MAAIAERGARDQKKATSTTRLPSRGPKETNVPLPTPQLDDRSKPVGQIMDNDTVERRRRAGIAPARLPRTQYSGSWKNTGRWALRQRKAIHQLQTWVLWKRHQSREHWKQSATPALAQFWILLNCAACLLQHHRSAIFQTDATFETARLHHTRLFFPLPSASRLHFSGPLSAGIFFLVLS